MNKFFFIFFIFFIFSSSLYGQYKIDFLKSFDINDPTLKFKVLGGTTEKNWAVLKNDKAVVNLKCTQRNTFYKGAIIAYELGKVLELDIYPVATEVFVDREIEYMKDGAMKKVQLAENCALKIWSENFAPYFWRHNSEKSTFRNTNHSKTKIVKGLKCENSLEENSFVFYSLSRRGSPNNKMINQKEKRVTYKGNSSLKSVIKDFSSMMLVDAIIGNDDRFPGGNLHFRAIEETYKLVGNTVFFEKAQLFSLDNESSLRGKESESMYNLKKFVSRFDFKVVENLRYFLGELKSAKDFSFLNFNTWRTKKPIRSYIQKNIEEVLKHVDDSIIKCGEAKSLI